MYKYIISILGIAMLSVFSINGRAYGVECVAADAADNVCRQLQTADGQYSYSEGWSGYSQQPDSTWNVYLGCAYNSRLSRSPLAFECGLVSIYTPYATAFSTFRPRAVMRRSLWA